MNALNENYHPLLWAVKNNKIECVSKLLNKGANPNIKYRHGITVLMYATKKGYTECIMLLLKAGADTTLIRSTIISFKYFNPILSGIDLDLDLDYKKNNSIKWLNGIDYSNPFRQYMHNSYIELIHTLFHNYKIVQIFKRMPIVQIFNDYF